MAISQRLKGALKLIGPKKPAAQGYKAIQILIWELMNTQSRLDKAEAKLAKLQPVKALKRANKKAPKPNAIAAKSIFDTGVSYPFNKIIRTKVKLPKNFGKVK